MTATMGSPRGTVLVVETDDLSRQLLCLWLGEAGYAVEALSSLAQDSQVHPDLVVLNVPRSSTLQAALESLSGRYSVPVVAISPRFRRGLGASAAAAGRLGVRRLLPKPFSREELLRAVAESLMQP